ncbi:Haemolysin-type calcium binding protein related domain-containing protein, partial [Pseudovibrio axinellae]|uniref:calcium-binding protein n=2 Tax=Pseudovibrio axinellae TaxID=989403 RepID=UPI0008CD9FEC
LDGTSGNDYIIGTPVSNIIYAGAGNDILDAGGYTSSWQHLRGQEGDDTYLIGKDDGQLWISRSAEWSSSGTDTLHFKDLKLSDLTIDSFDYETQGQVLRFSWDKDGQSGELRIADMGQHIERFEFADGSVLGGVSWRDDGRVELYGLADGQDSVIYGTAYDDFVYGGAGNDTLSAGAGVGGSQHLRGAGGNDTYLFGSGGGSTMLHEGIEDGIDTVRFTDLSLTGLSLSTTGSAADEPYGTVLNFSWQTGSGTDRLRISNHGQIIERFEFADGSVLGGVSWRDDGRVELYGLADGQDSVIYGTAYDDFVYGGAGNDTLSAGAGVGGSQHLRGAGGNDTYLFGSGGGSTMLHEGIEDGIDTVRFTDLSLAGLSLSTTGSAADEPYGTVLNFSWQTGSGTDRLSISNHGQIIERFEFADGSVLSGIKVRDDGRVELHGTDGDDLISGTGLGDNMFGGAGSDTFIFSDINFGNDVIGDFTAGAGSDDVIGFGTDLFASFEDLLTAAGNNGSDTVIRVNESNSVILKGVLVSDLHVDDFQFV